MEENIWDAASKLEQAQEDFKVAKENLKKSGGYVISKEIKGIMVFYIDVGSFPPFKAEAYIERYKDRLKEDGLIDQLRSQGYETLWVPVRPNSTTRIEMVPLSPDCMPMVTHQLDPDFLNEIEEDEEQ